MRNYALYMILIGLAPLSINAWGEEPSVPCTPTWGAWGVPSWVQQQAQSGSDQATSAPYAGSWGMPPWPMGAPMQQSMPQNGEQAAGEAPPAQSGGGYGQYRYTPYPGGYSYEYSYHQPMPVPPKPYRHSGGGEDGQQPYWQESYTPHPGGGGYSYSYSYSRRSQGAAPWQTPPPAAPMEGTPPPASAQEFASMQVAPPQGGSVPPGMPAPKGPHQGGN